MRRSGIMAQTPQDKMARPGHFSGMPHAEIKSKQAVFTLSQLHAELAGKLIDNKRAAIKIRTAMMQVEAVLQMLQPGFNVAGIAAKRRTRVIPGSSAGRSLGAR
jgi:hypothetical protein